MRPVHHHYCGHWLFCACQIDPAIVLTVRLHDFLPAEFKSAFVDVPVRLEDNEHRRAGWSDCSIICRWQNAAKRWEQCRTGAGAVVHSQAVVSTFFLEFYVQFRECNFYHLQQNRSIISRKKNVMWARHTSIHHFNTVVPEDGRWKTRKLSKISCISLANLVTCLKYSPTLSVKIVLTNLASFPRQQCTCCLWLSITNCVLHPIMCKLVVPIRNMDCRITNYEQIRWLFETLPRDIHHYRMVNVSVVDRAILQISHANTGQLCDHASLQVILTDHYLTCRVLQQ